MVGFNDLVEEVPEPPAIAVDDSDAEADEDDEAEVADDEEAEAGPTGPDPAEVARRMEVLATEYAKFKKANAKVGPQAKNVIKMRGEMAEQFVTFKLPLALTDTPGAQAARGAEPDQGPRAPRAASGHRRGTHAAQGFHPRVGRQPGQPGWVDEVLKRKQKWSSALRDVKDQIVSEQQATIAVEQAMAWT